MVVLREKTVTFSWPTVRPSTHSSSIVKSGGEYHDVNRFQIEATGGRRRLYGRRRGEIDRLSNNTRTRDLFDTSTDADLLQWFLILSVLTRWPDTIKCFNWIIDRNSGVARNSAPLHKFKKWDPS